MSSYSTREISREQAEEMLREIESKKIRFEHLSNHQLEKILDELAYSEEHTDVLGVLYNFIIVDKENN